MHPIPSMQQLNGLTWFMGAGIMPLPPCWPGPGMLPPWPLPPRDWLGREPWPEAEEEELPDLAACAWCPGCT